MRLMIFTAPVFFVFCACDVLVPATGQEHQPCFGDGTCLDGFFCEPAANRCLLPEEDCSYRECGPSLLGNDCGTCAGETDWCNQSGQCVDDCAGIECGQSPNGGFDCGTCSGAMEYCVSGQCVDLTWQNPPAVDVMTWQDAIDYCDGLTLDGHDDWHLPTISELRSLIRGCPATETGGSCGVTDSCLSYESCWGGPCDGCSTNGGPATGGCYWPDGMEGPCSWYWSPLSRPGDSSDAWVVHFDNGSVGTAVKVNDSFVRCVRGGP